MGVDTKLYLNTKYRLEDIKETIESITGNKVTVESHHDINMPGFFHFNVEVGREKRNIAVFCNTETPLGAATQLSLSLWGSAQELFKKIAGRLGGLYVANDSDDMVEMITGELSTNDGIPYFMKWAVIKKGIDANDLPGLIQYMNEWHAKLTQKYGGTKYYAVKEISREEASK